jgi:hypothetical protein
VESRLEPAWAATWTWEDHRRTARRMRTPLTHRACDSASACACSAIAHCSSRSGRTSHATPCSPRRSPALKTSRLRRWSLCCRTASTRSGPFGAAARIRLLTGRLRPARVAHQPPPRLQAPYHHRRWRSAVRHAAPRQGGSRALGAMPDVHDARGTGRGRLRHMNRHRAAIPPETPRYAQLS